MHPSKLFIINAVFPVLVQQTHQCLMLPSTVVFQKEEKGLMLFVQPSQRSTVYNLKYHKMCFQLPRAYF